METFLYRDGQQLGPYSLLLLKGLYEKGELPDTDLAWDDGSQTWRPISEFLRQVPSAPRPLSQLVQPSPQADTVFLNEGGITVTKTRFVARAQTFALAGITSVQAVKVPPSRTGPLVLLLFGILVFAAFMGNTMLIGAMVIGTPMLIGSVVWLFLQKPTFYSTILVVLHL